jgi:hypothetical protein
MTFDLRWGEKSHDFEATIRCRVKIKPGFRKEARLKNPYFAAAESAAVFGFGWAIFFAMSANTNGL